MKLKKNISKEGTEGVLVSLIANNITVAKLEWKGPNKITGDV